MNATCDPGIEVEKPILAANDHSYFSEKYPWIKRKGRLLWFIHQ